MLLLSLKVLVLSGISTVGVITGGTSATFSGIVTAGSFVGDVIGGCNKC